MRKRSTSYYLRGQRNVFMDFFRNFRRRKLNYGAISYGRGFYTSAR